MTYTQAQVVTALCIWEELLTRKHPRWNREAHNQGTPTMRARALELAIHIDRAWIACDGPANFDGDHDWVFIPEVVARIGPDCGYDAIHKVVARVITGTRPHMMVRA